MPPKSQPKISQALSNTPELPRTRSASQNQNQTQVSEDGKAKMATPTKPIDEVAFKKLDSDKKLDKVAAAINKIAAGLETVNKNLEEKLSEKIQPLWKAVFDAEEGLSPSVKKLQKIVLEEPDGLQVKVNDLEQAANNTAVRFSEMEQENLNLKRELAFLRGTIQKHEDQFRVASDKNAYLASKTMEKNLTITNIPESKDENCVEATLAFLQEKLSLKIADRKEIKVAHRMGSATETEEPSLPENSKASDKPRIMVLKVSRPLKNHILTTYQEYKESLGRKKPDFLIKVQLPEKILEKKREINHVIWECKSKEEHLPKQQKSRIQVRNNVVFINREPIRHKLPTIKLDKMFQDPIEQESIDSMVTHRSNIKTVKGSVFQAFATHANSAAEAHHAHIRIRQANPSASHVIAVYVSGTGDYAFNEDGEYGSGLRVIRRIKDKDFADIVVCIVRKFGGQHIGPQRFQVIGDLAMQAIERLP